MVFPITSYMCDSRSGAAATGISGAVQTVLADGLVGAETGTSIVRVRSRMLRPRADDTALVLGLAGCWAPYWGWA